MIKKIWNKLFGKKEEPKNDTAINFVIKPDGVVDLIGYWSPGKEQTFAELLYFINSGVLLEKMLIAIKTSCAKDGKLAQYDEMSNHLTRIYEEETKLLSQLTGTMQYTEDEPIVSPSDVFGGKDSNSLIDEGQEEEI